LENLRNFLESKGNEYALRMFEFLEKSSEVEVQFNCTYESNKDCKRIEYLKLKMIITLKH
jgi:hypothetical protein